MSYFDKKAYINAQKYSPRFVVKQYNDTCGRVIKMKACRNKGDFDEFIKDESKFDRCINTDTEEIERVSVSRTKRNIREIVLCNDFEYFATWTIDSKNFDRFSLDNVVYNMKKLLKEYKRRNKNFKYIYIIEQHIKSGFHFHGFVKGIPEEEFIQYTKEDYTFPKKLPYKLINEIEKSKKNIYHIPYFDNKMGYNTFSKVNNYNAAANYIMKYITKNAPVRTTENQIYFCSRGLKRASIIEINPDYEFSFQNQYSNEYLTIFDYDIRNLKHNYLLDLIMSYKM